ncbi:MAG: fumarylacetoacetate hydrolase family protein [Chloroflexi bacterium]|nr:fumarylacetoacetate hydrolase family protein [Chloroflexota bacterium]
MQIVRYRAADGKVSPGLLSSANQTSGHIVPLDRAVHDILNLRLYEIRALVEKASQTAGDSQPVANLLAPIDGDTEVWAAGVTYKRSEEARREESDTPDIYTKVYSAERPELFFKGLARRVSGPNAPIAVRADSTWDVPEPELVIAINAHGEIVGYTVGNDVSSRSIEGENPLYLPQAKVYAGSCALGPGITPAWEIHDPYNLTIHMSIERAGRTHWQGQTSTGDLKRRLDELATFLFRENEFPAGALLCTGTALVPEHPFTLEPGDVVEIAIDSLGVLRNSVVRGKAAYIAARKATPS